MGSLSGWFAEKCHGGGNTVAVIGSGGKTSLIWRLAAGPPALNSMRRVLVTPTTKMYVPKEKLYDSYCNGVPPEPLPGITLAGLFNEASGKLESLPLDELERICPGYDLVLMEADGARGLPLKAWADNEPVIPPFTAITVGVLPLWPLGKPVSEETIHRLQLFLALTGAVRGEPLKQDHLLTLIAGRSGSPHSGLFAKARGRKILFFNQMENEDALARARELTELLPRQFREGLDGIIAGSVRDNWAEEINFTANLAFIPKEIQY